MKKRLFLSLLFLFFVVFSESSWADFSLSVIPREGGNSLRFGRVRVGDVVNKEVTIRITSDVSTKYQLEQRLLGPLIDERGTRLDPQVFKFHTIRGSNARGSMYQDTLLPLDISKRVLYVSAANGASDSFSIIYVIDGRKINTSGSFFTQILYTLTPQAGGGTAQETLLNVYFNTSKQFDISVSTSSGSSRILNLSAKNQELRGSIKISTEGLFGSQYQINQTVQEPLKNEKGESIPLEICKFSLSAQKGQSFYSSFASLNRKPTLVYSSDSRGQGDDIIINFVVDNKDLENISSGYFRTTLLYSVESRGVLIKKIPIELNMQVKPVFDIEVISESVGGLRFTNVKPESGPMAKKVSIKVNSNMGKPYNVVQKLINPLVSKEGRIIPLEYFTFKQQLGSDQLGDIVTSTDTPLKLGDVTVFISDAKGSPSEFQIIYSLQIPRDMKGGDYYTGLSYSLVEK